jgi:hypothetical protein
VENAFMGFTSYQRISIAKTVAPGLRECAIGTISTSVSLVFCTCLMTSNQVATWATELLKVTQARIAKSQLRK